MSKRWTARASLLVCLIAFTCACGQSSSGAGPTPTPDGTTRSYVSLAQSYHDKYVAARGDGYEACVVDLVPPDCHDRGVAMIVVWESFLKDLSSLRASPRFAADVKIIRNQLPIGIGDLKAMVAAAAAGDKTTMQNAANRYISDMIP